MVNAVQRWEPVVRAELKAQAVPLPKELILAVMRVESQGSPGLVNPKSGASGLMQIMPITLKDFNQRHGKSYTMADMQSTKNEAAIKQIRVGIAVIAHYWKRAYQYLSKRFVNVPVDELAHISDLFYVAGPGNTIERLDQLSQPTWAAVKEKFPKWNALPHPTKVFKESHPWNVDRIGSWLEAPIQKIGKVAKDPRTGFALGILLLMVAYHLMKGKK